MTTGLNVQFAAHDAPIGAGVVHGVSETTWLRPMKMLCVCLQYTAETSPNHLAEPAETRRAISQNGVDHRDKDERDKHHRVHDNRRAEQDRFVDIKEAWHNAHFTDGTQMGYAATQQQERQRKRGTDAAYQQIVIPGLPTGWPSRRGS